MLNLSKPLTTAQAQAYHKHEFTSKEQSYWGQGGEILGTWQGRIQRRAQGCERAGVQTV
jgi:hypothetical protein